MWFIGFCAKVVLAPLLEKYGHSIVLKRLLIPMNIVAFQLQYLPGSFLLRCLGYLLAGLSRVKMIPLMLNLIDSVENKYSTYTTTFFWMFVFSVMLSFSIFMEYISRNAIYYLHLINGLSLICAAIFCSISVESPLRQIINGDETSAMKSLNYISRFNSFFSRKDPY